MTDLSLSFVVSSEALFQEVNGETVILDLKSEQYFSLDTVGTRVWQLLETGASIERILQLLLEEYEVDGSVLQSDVLELINSLENEGLVSPAPA